MKQILVTEEQLSHLIENMKNLKEDSSRGSYMAKQQLYTIAVMAHKMWEMMDDGEQLEDWMESKISQADQSITSVVKAFMYEEAENPNDPNKDIDFGDLVIGK